MQNEFYRSNLEFNKNFLNERRTQEEIDEVLKMVEYRKKMLADKKINEPDNKKEEVKEKKKKKDKDNNQISMF